MLNHLILTVDYTNDWERAMKRLPLILKLLGTRKLTLVYVIETHKRLHTEDQEGVVKGKLKALGEKLASELDVSTDYRIGRGFVASQVLEIAKTVHADGIIVCNRSHSATKELFFGNIALNLARMTKLPLLVIPIDGTPPAAEEEILYATDGSAASLNAQACFEQLITTGHDGRVLWVRPDDAGADDKDIEERIDLLANRHANVHRNIVTGRAVAEILKAIKRERPVLTVLGKRGATPITDLPLGSTTEKVAGASSQPILMVP
ncbi:universal stress protein [Marinobacter changyiensis]|uniref:universal stress protein n=1 Tax=Marinobacter changyiensis TaxID=2604091 RepID=UPI0015D180F2|nr:universal stress protein [Marinobacter changyiensis]